MLPVLFLFLYISIYIYVPLFFRILQMIMILTTTQITKITFVKIPMTQNHLNLNLMYLMMKLMWSHNHNSGLFVVLGWREVVVVGFLDIGQLALLAREPIVSAVHMLFQEKLTNLLHGVILLILKILTLTNCFMNMKGQTDFQC